MARVLETELICKTCGKTKEIPLCHGVTMEVDGAFIFCNSCQKEQKTPLCCEKPMQSHRKVRDIKKDLFKENL